MGFIRKGASGVADGFRANSKAIILAMLVVVLVMGAAFAAAFFWMLQEAEQVMVPNVEGRDLPSALIEMQAKELYPRIQLRYTDRPEERGLVLEQDPKAGAIVKAGRRVSLTVSRGVIVDQVDNFIGRNIDEVRDALQSLFTSEGAPLISIKEPVLYKASSEPAGTILEQDPAPETPISAAVQVSFVVSRGPDANLVTIPSIEGRSIAEIVALMESTELAFNFTASVLQGGETAGTVVSQEPGAGESVSKYSAVNAVLAMPATPPSGYVYGIFRVELPEYPYPFQIRIDVISPEGERREYLSMTHPGGLLSVPYLLPEGSVLSLNVLNKEEGLYEVESAFAAPDTLQEGEDV